MKKLVKIMSGNQVVLSDREMKQVKAGYNPGTMCDPQSITCGGSCEGWMEGPERPIYVKGTCQIVPEAKFLCGCVSNGSGGGPQ